MGRDGVVWVKLLKKPMIALVREDWLALLNGHLDPLARRLAVAKQQTHIARYARNLPTLPTFCRASRKPCHSSICVQVAEGYRADTFYADLRGAQPPGSGWPHPLLAVPGLRTKAGGLGKAVRRLDFSSRHGARRLPCSIRRLVVEVLRLDKLAD